MTTQTKIDPTARDLAFMKPGQRRELSSHGGVAVVLERASSGARTGRIVRESVNGFVVLQTITF
jgi:hypothetical protein